MWLKSFRRRTLFFCDIPIALITPVFPQYPVKACIGFNTPISQQAQILYNWAERRLCFLSGQDGVCRRHCTRGGARSRGGMRMQVSWAPAESRSLRAQAGGGLHMPTGYSRSSHMLSGRKKQIDIDARKLICLYVSQCHVCK